MTEERREDLEGGGILEEGSRGDPEQVRDPSSGTGADTGEETPYGRKRGLSPHQYRMARLGAIGLGLVIVGGYFVFSGGEERVNESRVPSFRSVDAPPGQRGETKRYEALIREENEDKAQRAMETGGSSVPTLTYNAADAELGPPPRKPEPEEDVVLPYTTGPEEAGPEFPPGAEEQLAAILASWGYEGHNSVVVSQGGSDKGREAGRKADPASSSGSSAREDVGELILRAGEVLYAVVDTEVDSDKPIPLRATILNGPLRGGWALGTFSVQGEGIVLRLNRVSMPGGLSMPVDAVAVDPSMKSLPADVDRHYLSRIGAAAAIAFTGALAELGRIEGQVTGSTQVTTGSTTVTTKKPSSGEKLRAAVGAGIGKVGELADERLTRVLTRPDTYRIPQGTGVGLLFLSDLVRGGGGVSGRDVRSAGPVERSDAAALVNGVVLEGGR